MLLLSTSRSAPKIELSINRTSRKEQQRNPNDAPKIPQNQNNKPQQRHQHSPFLPKLKLKAQYQKLTHQTTFVPIKY